MPLLYIEEMKINETDKLHRNRSFLTAQCSPTLRILAQTVPRAHVGLLEELLGEHDASHETEQTRRYVLFLPQILQLFCVYQDNEGELEEEWQKSEHRQLLTYR